MYRGFGVADVNVASRQPISRRNRCPEAADDAGIARKQRATALTAVQCVYAKHSHETAVKGGS